MYNLLASHLNDKLILLVPSSQSFPYLSVQFIDGVKSLCVRVAIGSGSNQILSSLSETHDEPRFPKGRYITQFGNNKFQSLPFLVGNNFIRISEN